MKRILVWDSPTRLFHWLLTALFLAAFGLAVFVRRRDPNFVIHELLGLVVGFMILLRIIWGFMDSGYSRFKSFMFGPKTLVEYVRGALMGSEKRHVGHNPGSSYAIFAMLLLPFILVVSGLLMPFEKGVFKELHELAAFAMIIVVGVHIVGVVWHTIRHKELIALSMIDGKKQGDPSEAIPSSRPLVGIAFLVLSAICATIVFRAYDPATRQLTCPLSGIKIELGETGENEKRGEGRFVQPNDDDDD